MRHRRPTRAPGRPRRPGARCARSRPRRRRPPPRGHRALGGLDHPAPERDRPDQEGDLGEQPPLLGSELDQQQPERRPPRGRSPWTGSARVRAHEPPLTATTPKPTRMLTAREPVSRAASRLSLSNSACVMLPSSRSVVRSRVTFVGHRSGAPCGSRSRAARRPRRARGPTDPATDCRGSDPRGRPELRPATRDRPGPALSADRGRAGGRSPVAPGLRVDPRAVAAQELVGGERAGATAPGTPLARPRATDPGAVRPADQHVPDALLELAHVARPGIVRAEVLSIQPSTSPATRLGLRSPATRRARNADEVAELPGSSRELLAQGRRADEVGAQAVVEVLAEAAAGDLLARSRLVAAMTLPRNAAVAVSPRRWNVARLQDAQELHLDRRRRARRSRRGTPCRRGGHASSQPARSSSAPVKAPRRWPKSSDSMSVGESADRFSGEERAGGSPANALRLPSNGM